MINLKQIILLLLTISSFSCSHRPQKVNECKDRELLFANKIPVFPYAINENFHFSRPHEICSEITSVYQKKDLSLLIISENKTKISILEYSIENKELIKLATKNNYLYRRHNSTESSQSSFYDIYSIHNFKKQTTLFKENLIFIYPHHIYDLRKNSINTISSKIYQDESPYSPYEEQITFFSKNYDDSINTFLSYSKTDALNEINSIDSFYVIRENSQLYDYFGIAFKAQNKELILFKDDLSDHYDTTEFSHLLLTEISKKIVNKTLFVDIKKSKNIKPKEKVKNSLKRYVDKSKNKFNEVTNINDTLKNIVSDIIKDKSSFKDKLKNNYKKLTQSSIPTNEVNKAIEAIDKLTKSNNTLTKLLEKNCTLLEPYKSKYIREGGRNKGSSGSSAVPHSGIGGVLSLLTTSRNSSSYHEEYYHYKVTSTNLTFSSPDYFTYYEISPGLIWQIDTDHNKSSLFYIGD